MNEIYIKNKLPKICSKFSFKPLLLELTIKNTFTFKIPFYYIFRYVYNLKFYKCFVDDIINRRNKNQPDDLFQKLNSNHQNMKYAVEVNPEIFLDRKIV